MNITFIKCCKMTCRRKNTTERRVDSFEEVCLDEGESFTTDSWVIKTTTPEKTISFIADQKGKSVRKGDALFNVPLELVVLYPKSKRRYLKVFYFARLVQKVMWALSDYRHGGNTGGFFPSPYSSQGATPTTSTHHKLIPFLLGPVLRPNDVFVDVGCGRGRVLNWVDDDGRAKEIVGLEINNQFAAEVAKRFKGNPKVTVVAGDALASLPESGTVFYLWNPFDQQTMERFKEILISKYAAIGSLSGLRVIYHNCLFADVWKSDPRCQVTRIVLPPDELNEAILIKFVHDSVG
jgi:hypothetical protein